jgi:predicted CXXCH cytochrome family protein
MGIASCITCHSNHRIVHPTDKLIGTGNEAVCTNCHASGDPGFAAAARIHDDLVKLDEALKRSEEVLDKAERSGMEVSSARLEEAQGRDSLTKARVTLHSFQPVKVEQDTQAGMKIADKTYAAGVQALAERDYRRKGLGLALITIFVVLAGLRMYIRQAESRNPSGGS